MDQFLLVVDSQDVAYQIGAVMGMIVGVVIYLSIPLLLILSIFRYVKTRHKGWLVAAILSGIPVALFVIGFIGTFSYMIYKEIVQEDQGIEVESDESISTHEISAYETVSMDGDSVFIKIPDHWELLEDLNEHAIFQAGAPSRDEFLIALHYPREDADRGLGVISDFLIQNMLADLDDPVVVSVERIMIGGMDAYQYEIVGVFNDMKVAYLQTVIESSEFYLHILAWTLKSDRDAVFPIFKEVVDSIDEREI